MRKSNGLLRDGFGLQKAASKACISFAFALLAVPMTGNAAAVTWYVNGVTFNDGGTLSGSFAYDASTDAFSSISLTTTVGTILDGASYAHVTNEEDADFADFLSPNFPVVIGTTTRLSLFLNQEMTNAGGTISLAALSEQLCAGGINGPCTPSTSPDVFRFAGGASISSTAPVPLPAAAWLLLSGLGGLGFLGRRRRAN